MNHRLTVVTYEGAPSAGIPLVTIAACDCGWHQHSPTGARDSFADYRAHLPPPPERVEVSIDTMALDNPPAVAYHLREASSVLARAHAAATEEDGLTGNVRDLLYGMTSAIDALLGMVEAVIYAADERAGE